MQPVRSLARRGKLLPYRVSTDKSMSSTDGDRPPTVAQWASRRPLSARRPSSPVSASLPAGRAGRTGLDALPGWKDVTTEWECRPVAAGRTASRTSSSCASCSRPRRRATLLRRPRARPAGRATMSMLRAAADDEHDGADGLAGRRGLADRRVLRRPGAPVHVPIFSDRRTDWPSHPHATRDSLHEHDMWVAEGLTHRYPTKVLAELLPTCPRSAATARAWTWWATPRRSSRS